MKKLIYSLAVLCAAFGCQGTIDPENSGQQGGEGNGDIPSQYTAPFTLTADKDVIEANGADYANFSLKDAYGREMLTDMDALSNINIRDEHGNYLERRSVSVRAIENGVHTYTASYKGKESTPVQIKAQNRGLYEKYFKKVAVYKMTGTGCIYCPSMTRALSGLDEEATSHSVIMAWHGGTDWNDPYTLTFKGYEYDCAVLLLRMFADRSNKSIGFPALVLDLNQVEVQRSSSVISSSIWEQRADYPATSGLKMSSEYNSADSCIDIDVELTTSTGGSYDVGVALLLDGEYYPEGKEEDGMYNHIVVANSGNYYTYFSDKITDLAKDQSKQYSFSLSSSIVDITSKLDKVTVVAYALVKGEDGYARIDNVTDAPVGESVDYILND